MFFCSRLSKNRLFNKESPSNSRDGEQERSGELALDQRTNIQRALQKRQLHQNAVNTIEHESSRGERSSIGIMEWKDAILRLLGLGDIYIR